MEKIENIRQLIIPYKTHFSETYLEKRLQERGYILEGATFETLIEGSFILARNSKCNKPGDSISFWSEYNYKNGESIENFMLDYNKFLKRLSENPDGLSFHYDIKENTYSLFIDIKRNRPRIEKFAWSLKNKRRIVGENLKFNKEEDYRLFIDEVVDYFISRDK